MEDKQYKQTERFSVITKVSDYFLSLDDKFKQRQTVKTDNMQGYDPYEVKKEELSGDINKFPPVKNFQAILINFHLCSDVASLFS